MKKWDIYIADVPFEDFSQKKVPPVLILEDAVVFISCLKMTSHAPREGEYLLRRWKEAGLRKPTTVRLSKRLKLQQRDIRKWIGTLHPIDIIEIERILTV